MIFAWNDEDPITGNNDWEYHSNNRFVRFVSFLNFKSGTIAEQNILPSDTFTRTYAVNDVRFVRLKDSSNRSIENKFFFSVKLKVPAKKTYYYCDLYEYPQFDVKTHLFQFEMLINPKYIKNVHHLLVYECYPGTVRHVVVDILWTFKTALFLGFNKTEELARECGEVRLPPYVGGYCMGKLIIGKYFENVDILYESSYISLLHTFCISKDGELVCCFVG